MFYVVDPYSRMRQLIAGPFASFEEARQDASERNIAGDLLIVSTDAGVAVGDADGMWPA